MASKIMPADFYLKHVEELSGRERRAWKKSVSKKQSKSIIAKETSNLSNDDLRDLKGKARRQAWCNAGLFVLLTTGTILGCQYFANVGKIVQGTDSFEPLTPILTNAVETVGRASNFVVQGAKSLASMAKISMPAPNIGQMLYNAASPLTNIADVALKGAAFQTANMINNAASYASVSPTVPLLASGALTIVPSAIAVKKSFGKLQDGRNAVKAIKKELKTR